jgi:hypothetical protein
VLWHGRLSHAEAEVEIPQEAAWRLFTKGIGPVEALGTASFTGSQALGRVVLDMVSIIA